MKRIACLLLLCAFSAIVKAQDPHYSQFFASPLTLNPAFTGKFDGNFRVTGNYKNQWPAINKAFQTTSVSADFALLKNRLAFGDTWGLGITALSDKSAGGAVKFNYLSLSTAYHKSIDQDGYQQIGLGFQATYSNMLINTTQLKFEDQLTSIGFTGVTNEVFANSDLKAGYFDVNVGALYTGSTNDYNNFYAGLSIYHINRPQEKFTGANYFIEPRYTVHGGGYFPVSEAATVHVSGLYSSQAGSAEMVAGGTLQLKSGEAVNVYVGGWMRMKDAIIPYVGLEFGDFRLGASYDVNTSELRTASQSKGGIELSLIYIRKPADSNGLPCPKF